MKKIGRPKTLALKKWVNWLGVTKPFFVFLLRARDWEPPLGGVRAAECGGRPHDSFRRAENIDSGESLWAVFQRLEEVERCSTPRNPDSRRGGVTRHEACANAWRGACAALKRESAEGFSAGHDSFAGVACVGAAGDSGRVWGLERGCSATGVPAGVCIPSEARVEGFV